jgi:hypothetical protein
MKSARKKTKSTKSPGIKLSKKGVIKILSVVVIAAVLAWFFVITHLFSDSTEETSYAAPRNNNVENQVVLEAENMSTVTYSGGVEAYDDPSASGGKAMRLSLTTSTNGGVSLTNGTSKLSVVAMATRCHGGPTMTIFVDGTEVMNKKIAASSWSDYNTSLNLPPGSHDVMVSLKEDYTSTTGQGCDRTLFVDKLIFQ